MAARSGDPPEPSPPPPTAAAAAAAGGEIWGTLEELLLACAVRRHGTASWESVATAVQSRTRPSAAARLSPNSCRLRYRLLHRRFAGGDDEDAEPDAAADAWVEELRKLRVAELRREVERYDLSIGSLKSKVKRLKEERERGLSGEAAPASKKEEEREAANGSTEEAGGQNGVSGEPSGRSCKESTSSDLKPPPGHDSGGAPADDGKPEVKEEPAEAGEVAVKKESSGESVAGSKEADAEKESSDVQSAASPSRRRRRRRLRKVGGGELASASAPVALPAAEAEPLLAFLESVRTSKSGAVFERRLESQESGEYRATIRRHVDLEMIRSRLESGGAASGPGSATCYASASEFYRDLLLLCANALVFFPRGSPEHAAAARTRALVSKRISSDLHKDGPGTSGKDAAAGAVSKKPKADAEVAGSLLEKAAPIIVCRKRSSIAKAAAAAAGKEEKVEKGDTDDDEEEEDEGRKKGGAKDKAKGVRTNKGRGPAKSSAPNQKTGKVSESAAAAEGTKKSDKKGGSGGKPAAAGGVIKKRNAVDFLKRMKQSTVPSTERVSLLETLKLSAATEQKKAGKGNARKDPGSSSGSKKSAAATESGSGGRRSVGRPPKRAAAPPTPPPSKRAKEDRPTRKRGGKK
ncbi:nucleolar and coiled-body phosphoprotein 1-like [Lolium rigidum]|uniref:nucleolar and coiled-body phosphoprotein 1-like n=1 Tax=Lolium rigidum TaxID=89674 RepID=UPI001F5C1C8A|nr:nucleolar and coiled-body phosphoprotein 1-like [Lolium rigidum]